MPTAQEYLQQIFEAVRAEDEQAYRDAFETLAAHLLSGGAPPVLRSLHDELGPVRVAVHSPYNPGATEPRPRKTLISRPTLQDCETRHTYYITVADPNNNSGHGPYWFVIYQQFTGNRLHQYDLPME